MWLITLSLDQISPEGPFANGKSLPMSCEKCQSDNALPHSGDWCCSTQFGKLMRRRMSWKRKSARSGSNSGSILRLIIKKVRSS